MNHQATIKNWVIGTLAEFSEAVKVAHGDSNHRREYAAAIQMIEAHAAIWTPLAKEGE